MVADAVVRGLPLLLTMDAARPGPLGAMTGAAVAVADGRIAWVGPDADAPSAERVIDGSGAIALPGLGSNVLAAADELQGQMRWLHHQLRRREFARLQGVLRLLASRLEEWQARYHALAQVCQTPGYTVYTPRVSRSPLFDEIRELLKDDGLVSQWATLPEADADSVRKTLEAMAAFSRAEEAAALGKALAIPETIILWLLRLASTRQVDGIDDFLWGLLGRSHRAALPGHREEEVEDLLVASLLTEYAGGERQLAESLSLQPLDVETHLRLLVRIENHAPGAATERLWEQLAGWAEEDPASLLLADALNALRHPPEVADWVPSLESLAETTSQPAVRRAALDCLQRLAPSVEHHLLALRWALAGYGA